MSRHPWRQHHPGFLRSRNIDTEQKNRDEHRRTMEREAVMRRYEDARQRVGDPVRLTYESGWVIVNSRHTQKRVRLAVLTTWAEQIEAYEHEQEIRTEDT